MFNKLVWVRSLADRKQVVAIIDIDCAELEGFDEVDKKYLEIFAGILATGCDF
jgi:L-methionine (R)-S-oxide reductase